MGVLLQRVHAAPMDRTSLVRHQGPDGRRDDQSDRRHALPYLPRFCFGCDQRRRDLGLEAVEGLSRFYSSFGCPMVYFFFNVSVGFW